MNTKKKLIIFVFFFANILILFSKLDVQAATIKKTLSSPLSTIGWQKENSTWYYYNSDNKKAAGWIKINNSWYYLKDDKGMATGWLKDNDKWYYFQGDGSMMSSTWFKDNDKWYYLNSSGDMKTCNWLNYNGKWYYLQDDGSMMSSTWLKDNDKWYYLNSNGDMKTCDWLNYNGKWYYLQSDGSMATNTVVDGWIINKDGVGSENHEITDDGVKFIANYEGYSATAYRGQDAQNQTIGYGHVIQSDENFTSLTEAQASTLLKNDLTKYVDGVNSATDRINLNNNQFDALVSFSYNCGLHTFTESQLLKDIKANASSDVLKDDFCNYIHTTDASGNRIESLGLWRRRMDEWNLYVNGDYERDYPNW